VERSAKDLEVARLVQTSAKKWYQPPFNCNRCLYFTVSLAQRAGKTAKKLRHEAVGLKLQQDADDNQDKLFWVQLSEDKVLKTFPWSAFPKGGDWQAKLREAASKGTTGRMTKLGGDGESVVSTRSRSQLTRTGENLCAPSVLKQPSCPHVVVCGVSLAPLFKSATKWCVLYALLNVLRASKRQATNMRNALKTKFCGLSDLAGKTRKHLGVSLKKFPDATLAWLLGQAEGKFLIYQGKHCVSADLDKGHLLDCAKDYVLTLSIETLNMCGFTDGQGPTLEIRQVV
jgi:hypothetical protein